MKTTSACELPNPRGVSFLLNEVSSSINRLSPQFLRFFKKGGSEMESDGAFGSGQCRVSLGFEPLPTRVPMLSPFHAYIIAHKIRFVKGF